MLSPENKALVERIVHMSSIETVEGGLSLTKWFTLGELLNAAREEGRASAPPAQALDRIADFLKTRDEALGSVGPEHTIQERAESALAILSLAQPAEGWRSRDRAIYTIDERGVEPLRIPVEIVGPVEGWWEVRCSDDSTVIVRPSRLTPQAGER